jgi:hypothetical protein
MRRASVCCAVVATLASCGGATDLDIPAPDRGGGASVDERPLVDAAYDGQAAPNDSADSGQSDTCETVLLISTSTAAPPNLARGLKREAPAFCAIDYVNANDGTPAPSALAAYDAVLVFNENNAPYGDPSGLGNALAMYFDGGGRVVTALFADGGYNLQGTFASQYLLIAPIYVPQSSDSFTNESPLEDLVPASAVLAGVRSIRGSGWHGSQGKQNGGVAVADWASGELLAVTGVVTDSSGRTRRRVDLNIQPTDVAEGAWKGDAFRLLANALLYQ